MSTCFIPTSFHLIKCGRRGNEVIPVGECHLFFGPPPRPTSFWRKEAESHETHELKQWYLRTKAMRFGYWGEVPCAITWVSIINLNQPIRSFLDFFCKESECCISIQMCPSFSNLLRKTTSQFWKQLKPSKKLITQHGHAGRNIQNTLRVRFLTWNDCFNSAICW